jgi:signal peptidase I
MEHSWARVLAASLSRAVLTVTGGLLLWATLPAAVGWHPAVIMSGSMLPAIAAGDVIVDKDVATDQLKPGQVLVVEDPDHPGRLRTHRLVRVDRDGLLVLRGDANPMPDSSRVSPEAVVGGGGAAHPAGRPTRHLGLRAALGASGGPRWSGGRRGMGEPSRSPKAAPIGGTAAGSAPPGRCRVCGRGLGRRRHRSHDRDRGRGAELSN